MSYATFWWDLGCNVWHWLSPVKPYIDQNQWYTCFVLLSIAAMSNCIRSQKNQLSTLSYKYSNFSSVTVLHHTVNHLQMIDAPPAATWLHTCYQSSRQAPHHLWWHPLTAWEWTAPIIPVLGVPLHRDRLFSEMFVFSCFWLLLHEPLWWGALGSFH